MSGHLGKALPELPNPMWRATDAQGDPRGLYTAEQVRTYAAEAVRLAIQRERSAAGQLPDGAVAWLDMGKGEVELVFTKGGSSNRAYKRSVQFLFDKVPPGYHPLYLHPYVQSHSDPVVGTREGPKP
jgi:hypothetical protein